ncbi:MAG: hypothetical protein AB1925_22670 [Actinomycetota bacterium]
MLRGSLVSVAVSTVEASDPQGVTAAASELTSRIADLDGALAEHQQALARVRASWQASARDAAAATAEQDVAALTQMRDRLESVRTALTTGGAHLDAVRTGLVGLVAALRGMGWTITDDGHAIAPVFPPLLKHFEPGFSAVIQRLLQLFDQIDATTAEAISRAVAP